MEAFLFSLLGMLIGGISVVAYRHYEAFPRIFNVLFYGSLGVFVLLFVWDGGLLIFGIYITDELDYEASKQVREAVDSLLIPMPWIVGVWVAWSAYLTVLRLLPEILGMERKKPEN